MHTFLLVNGFDLEVQPLVAYEFMMQSISTGEFRFGLILEWINKHMRAS
jgi:prophage maintenance system killer protein